MSDRDAKEAMSRVTCFMWRFRELAVTAASGENLANVAFPASIILGCAAIGALIVPPWGVGAGIGALIGKVVTGEMSAGKAADDIARRHASSDDQDPSSGR